MVNKQLLYATLHFSVCPLCDYLIYFNRTKNFVLKCSVDAGTQYDQDVPSEPRRIKCRSIWRQPVIVSLVHIYVCSLIVDATSFSCRDSKQAFSVKSSDT